MEFYIKKNATLPLLKLQVVKDGRSDYNKFMDLLEVSSLFFSMVDIETGIPKITSRPAGFVEKTFIDPNAEPEYYIYYQFTNKDTNKVGRFEGQFMLRSSDGNLILPIREKLYIDIQESFIADDLDYESCYVSEFPCCVNPPSTTTTTTVPCPSCPVCTQTPTPTPTPTPIPLNDLTYLLIPDGGLSSEFITGATITLSSVITPGSVVVNFLLTSNEILPSGLTLNFTQILGLVTGGTINIPTSVSILSGGTTGATEVIISEYNFSDLDGSSSFSGVTFVPSGATISTISENTNFIGPTPTPTSTPSPTPTGTPTPTPTPTPTSSPVPLGNVNLMVLGDAGNISEMSSGIQIAIENLNYTCNLTTRVLSTTYDGDELTGGTYDVVVMYTNSSDYGSTNLSNNLQTFVDDGGGLVTGTFLWNLYAAGFDFNLTPFVGPEPQTNDTTGSFSILSASSILSGVSSPIGSQLINQVLTLQSGVTLNAQYDTSGYGLLATRQYGISRQVGINAFLGFINSYTDNGLRRLTANSVLWAASLLEPTPISCDSFTFSGNNVTTTSSGATKTSGGGWDSAAYSLESFNGSSSVTFQIRSAGDYLMGGFSYNPTLNPSNTYTSIAYGFYIQNNFLEIYENGNQVSVIGATTITSSDIWKVEWDSVDVKYYKNGGLIYTSLNPVTNPLFIFFPLLTSGGGVTNVCLNTLSILPTPTPTSTPTPTPTPTSSPLPPLILRWQTNGSRQITLPYSPTGIYSGTINWGDTTTSTNSYVNRTHTYPPGSEYQIKTITITGNVEGFDATLTPDYSRLFEVLQWGSLRGESNSNENMFYNCYNLTLTGVTGTPNWGGVTSYKRMFAGAGSISTVNGISTWNTSMVTNMSEMFAYTFFDDNISGWNTSNVTNMDGMFNDAEGFNQDLSGWCVNLIPSLPTNFDDFTFLWVLPRPVWGTCPP